MEDLWTYHSTNQEQTLSQTSEWKASCKLRIGCDYFCGVITVVGTLLVAVM